MCWVIFRNSWPLALSFDSQRRILNSTKTGFIYDILNVSATFDFEATTNLALFRRYKIDANLRKAYNLMLQKITRCCSVFNDMFSGWLKVAWLSPIEICHQFKFGLCTRDLGWRLMRLPIFLTKSLYRRDASIAPLYSRRHREDF